MEAKAYSKSVPDYDVLEAELQRPVTTWRPHKDDEQPRTLIGLVVDRYLKTSDFTDQNGVAERYPVLIVDDERSETAWVVYASAGMLKGKVERLDPRIGDRVGVGYGGRADENDERSPQRWNLKIIEQGEPSTQQQSDDSSGEADKSPGGGVDDIPFRPAVI
jgi:hypothetical protein